jgi:hypothetical protein
MYISKKRSGAVCLKSSACVELLTSPSSTTTSRRAAPSAASASPYAFRVATGSVYVFHSGFRGASIARGCQASGAGVGNVRDGSACSSASAGGRLLLVERLAVPALLVLDERDAFALHRLGDDDGRPLGGARAAEGVVDGGEVVAVDDDRLAAEGLHARGVRLDVPLELGRTALAQSIHVEDRR